MSLSSSSSLVEKDKKYFFHPFTALKTHESDGGKIIVEGKGSTLTDSQGNKIGGLKEINYRSIIKNIYQFFL